MFHVIVNPPSKTVKGLAEGTLRTTMTHLIVGDIILVMTATADPLDVVKAAPTVAPKRAFWVTVATVAMSGISVVTETGGRIIITDCAPQVAVTIKDRTLATAEVTPTATVVIQGSHVHAEPVPCGRVYDDEYVNGVDTEAPVTCPGCLSQPTEVIAGDGSVIRVGSRVIVAGEARHHGRETTGTVECLADYREGEWVISVTVRMDDDRKPWGCYPASLATLTGSELRRYPIDDADVVLLSGEPVPLAVVHDVTIEEAPAGRGRKTFAVWSCRGKRKATRVNRRRGQVGSR